MKIEYGNVGYDDKFDFCVIGTGPAGMACTLTLASSGKRILLLEGGTTEATRDSQQLYMGSSSGDPYFDLSTCRLRYFGGTSNHWEGWCRPLDECDFLRKAETDTGWPITRSDIEPYVAEASAMLDIPPVPADRQWGDSGLNRIDFVWAPPHKHLRWYAPVRILRKYLDLVIAHRNISLLLDANVTQLETDGDRVSAIHVQSLSGDSLRARADNVILATGGIENSRLLLWSNELSNGRLIKNESTLGRYWMEHPHFTLGSGIVDSRFLDDAESSQRRLLFFAPTPATMAQYGILSCGLRAENSKEDVNEIIRNLSRVAPKAAQWAAQLQQDGLVRPMRVRAAWEQEPASDNRITLGRSKDRFGIPQPHLHWRKSQLDRRTARVTAELFGSYLAKNNIGRVRLDAWISEDGDFPPDDETGGNHHLGGTRMAATPREGIVDRNCKVFGQQNLYVAGSSVFPSGGHANPTMTIVQLAIRLGHHLIGKG